MLDRLRRNRELEIAVPVFDHTLEISRAAARMISQDINLLIVEGNYLLLDQPPWSELAPFFDLTVSIDVPEDELRRRLYARWERQGLRPSDIPLKVEVNDMPNGRLVLTRSRPSDFVLRNGHERQP
jgi:pantothenate kinase